MSPKKRLNLPRRWLVTHSPNYACTAAKVAYDSSQESKFKDFREAYNHFSNLPVEDESTRIWLVGSELSNEDFLKSLNGAMEIATDISTYYSDSGVRARKTIEAIDQLLLPGGLDKEVQNLIDLFYEEVEALEKELEISPKFPIRPKE